MPSSFLTLSYKGEARARAGGGCIKTKTMCFQILARFVNSCTTHSAPPSEDLVVAAKLGTGNIQKQPLLPAHKEKEKTVTKQTLQLR